MYDGHIDCAASTFNLKSSSFEIVGIKLDAPDFLVSAISL